MNNHRGSVGLIGLAVVYVIAFVTLWAITHFVR